MADVKTVRLRHVTTGAIVQVREDKVLGSEWEPVKAPPVQAKPAPKRNK